MVKAQRMDSTHNPVGGTVAWFTGGPGLRIWHESLSPWLTKDHAEWRVTFRFNEWSYQSPKESAWYLVVASAFYASIQRRSSKLGRKLRDLVIAMLLHRSDGRIEKLVLKGKEGKSPWTNSTLMCTFHFARTICRRTQVIVRWCQFPSLSSASNTTLWSLSAWASSTADGLWSSPPWSL